MKKFLTIATMFALAVGFVACSGSDDGGSTPPANPKDEFVNRATSKSGLALAATHHFLEVSENAEPVVIKFAVFNNGQDVTSNASVYVLEGNSSKKLVDAKFTPEATGVYQFWASYGVENTKADALLNITAVSDMPALPADVNPASTNFFRRVLIAKATGVNCPNCPRATDGIHMFFDESDYADNAVLMGLNTYDTGDPLWSKAAETLTSQAGLGASYPAIKLNFDNLVPTLGSADIARMLNENIAAICANPSETAIAVSTSYNPETGAISVAAKVKCDVPSKYKVTAALLQDNVFFPQQGASKPEHNVHGSGVKAIAPTTGVGFALNNGDETKAGGVYDFCCEFNASDLYSKGTGDYALNVLRDARVIVYVQAADKIVDNVVACGLNQKVGFAYNN